MEKYSDPIYFTGDIINMCEDKLGGLSKKSVEEVLKLIVTYIHRQKLSDDISTMEIPSLGTMYRSLYKMQEGSKEYCKTISEMAYLEDEELVKAMFADEAITKMYGKISREELQKFQNNGTPVEIKKKKPNRLARSEKTALRKMPQKYKEFRENSCENINYIDTI